ncbi:MAG: ATP-binding protein [Rhodoferax sp.]|nr:ATP-binding protein [Rhodoferax sp.]
MDKNNTEVSPQARILIVDDDVSNLAALGRLLRPHYDVFAAPNGERALQIATGTPQPDLILLDVMMPGMDGYEVLNCLRDTPVTCDIPVIFVSGLDTAEDEEKGFEVGAVDYIAKPYRPAIILARVRTQLELKRARDGLANQNTYLESEIVRRIQEIQLVQMELLQSEKLAAIGQLTAGIVHEINTPVAYVSFNLGSLEASLRDIFELLDAYEHLEGVSAPNGAELEKIRKLKQLKEIDFLRDDIGELLTQSRQGLARVAKIVSDLKSFSRTGGSDWLWTNLHNELDSTLNIVGNEIKYHCTVHKDYGEIPEVYCIPSQINQVLLNLLVNAAQAIPEKGDISIHTGQVEEEVFLAISDTGTGIPTDTLPRLFEPFFTTKPVGKGTGLGLSISYGIVQKHGGRIEVESALGKGTTFTVWLPIKPPGKTGENKLQTE